MPDLFLRLTNDDLDDELDTSDAAVPPRPSEAEALCMLRGAKVIASKLIPWGSNYTFAVGLISPDGSEHLGIYKPEAGEQPLWDFPHGTLYLREHASYLLSRRLGWDIVPPTVVRDGPNGVGSMQLYIEPDPAHSDDHSFWRQRRLDIERLVLFDHIANNADRKIAHCLIDRTGKVWGIDHGLTFNEVPKLRTVLWHYINRPIDARLREDLRRLLRDESGVRAELADALSRRELDALIHRTERLTERGHYPALDPHRNIPYGWW